jgi:uncharacterized protein (TIGR03437 family)
MLRFLLVFLPLSLSALPLRFELNQGQYPPSVLFAARGVAFTTAGARFPGGTRMTLAGGRTVVPQAGAPTGRISYLVGPDRAGWRFGVPQYGEIRYREVYPGIDLLFHDSAGKLEYDFRLGPGADPTAIRLRFRGAGRAALDGEDLVAGSLRHHRPVAFQESAAGRRAVAVRYCLHDGEVRFELGPYDRALPLVIDPVLSYATYAGGSGAETGSAIAVDAAGNAYLAGTTDSPNFPAFKVAAFAAAHAFLVKLDGPGANFTSTVVIGGATIDGIALDSTGNPVVTGSITDATQFPGATPGAYQAGATGFVARFTQGASGFKLAFVSTFAATPAAVALDPKDFIFVAGAAGAGFLTTAGALQAAFAGGTTDGFVLKLSTDGARALYATYLGGKAEDAARAIAVNSGGEAYIAGDTASADFRITPGAAQSTFGGRVVDGFMGEAYGDAFAAKLDAAGANLVFSTYLGGTAPDIAYGIALDKDGNAYVTGSTQSADFPTTAGTVQPKYAGGTPASQPDPSGDAFIARFSVNGARVWSTFLGGSARDIAEAIAVDGAGNVVVAGASDSGDFPRTGGALSGCRSGGPWVAQLDNAGARLLVSTSLPGTAGLDEPHALALDSKGIVYLAGDVTSRVFFATPAAAQQAYGGGGADAFAARLDLSAPSRLSVACVVNAASFEAGNFANYPLGTVAPGEIVSLFGIGVGPDQPVIAQPVPGSAYPTLLGGTRVLFDGVPAPLLYVAANQVNAVVPYGIKSPVTEMTVERGGISDGPRPLPVAPAVPGIFTANSAGFGQAAVLNEDGSYNSVANPAARGSIIVFYAVGAGAMTPPVGDGAVSPESLPLPMPQLPVTVQIRGVDAGVPLYAGAAPGFVSGLMQVNVRVPDSINFGNSVPLTLLVGGQASQSNVTIAVK